MVFTNTGLATATAPWLDRLELVDQSGRSFAIDTINVTNVEIAAGGYALGEDYFVIPWDVPLAGTVAVRVRTDFADAVVEKDENNNSYQYGWLQLSKSLRLTSASDSVSESANNGARLTILRSGPVDDPVTVSLTCDSTEATLPEAVTIPAGASRITFTVVPVNNSVVDGNRTISVYASADDFESSSLSLTIVDDEVPHLYLTLDSDSIRENGGAVTATVRRELVSNKPLTVNLGGASTSRCTYPSSVVIPSGEDSVTFEISVPDDDTAQIAQDLTLRAYVEGYESATHVFTVEDDDIPGVRLTISPDTVQEGGVVRATIARDGEDKERFYGQAITVRLTASNLSEIASMTSELTLPRGVMSGSFNIYIADYDVVNDEKIRDVTITGKVRIDTCNCYGVPSSGAEIEATLGIIDNDGPALALKADPTKVLKRRVISSSRTMWKTRQRI